MTTWHHEERLRAVLLAVRESGASRVLDLGCGDGDMFVRLAAMPGLTELVGLEIRPDALTRLRARLRACVPSNVRIDLREASVLAPAPDLAGFDCAILVEVIEHLEPALLSRLENALFHMLQPAAIIITTPNAAFNALLGVPPHRMRHPDHKFEWDRAKFRQWCARAAQLAGYDVRFQDIAGAHPDLGGASQMAAFDRTAAGDEGGAPPRTG